jgi:transcriptional regulator with XRE-family HTH domain
MFDPPVLGPREREQRSMRPLLRTILGEALRQTRLEQGRTLADVAKVAKVSLPYLSELERGRKEASSEILAAICDALEIELQDLLAKVESGLVTDRASRAQIIRLDTIHGHPGSPQALGPGDVRCRLVA